MKLYIRSLIITAIIALLILIFITLAGCASIAEDVEGSEMISSERSVETLVEMISNEMKAKKITGISLAVSNSEEVLWVDGFGLADRKSKTEFTGETVSNVGSVSKLLTSAAVMRLVEMGKVDLDEPVSTYIPEFDPVGSETFSTPITVRMLLNHESGLDSDAFHGFFLGHERPEDFPVSYRKSVDAVNAVGIVRDPYEMFSYCNLGYSLLGIIIERATGSNFQESVSELVFAPLGMNDSSFNIDDIPEERMATGYLQGKPEKLPYLRDMPAGSLNSTARDMGAFLQNILASYRDGDGLLSQKTVKELFTTSNSGVSMDLDFRVGLTWWIVDLQELPGEFIVGHGGDLPPYYALVIMLPEKDISVFAMVNSVEGVGSFSLTPIVLEAVRTFLDEDAQQSVSQTPEVSPVVEMPESLRSSLLGYYASPIGLSEIKEKGDKLKIFTFNRWFDVYYHEDNSLTLGYKLLGIFPLKMPVFDEISISLEDMGSDPSINLRIQDILISPAVKIVPGPIDPAWISRIGSYKSVEPEVMPQYTDFRIDIDGDSGFLCLYLKSSGEWSKFPLQTVDDTSAQLMGIGRSLGGYIRVSSDDMLSFQNFQLRKM